VIGILQPGALFLATLIIAPLKTLIATERPGLPDVGQLALALTSALWLIHRVALRKRIIVWSGVYWPIIAIVLGASFSLFAALDPVRTLTELSKWVEVLIAAALTVTICVEQHSVAWPAIGILATGLVQAVLGIYQFFGGSGAPNLWILNNRFFRAFGTFGQPNPFGACLGLALPIAIGWLYARLSDRRRLDPIGAALLITVVILADGLVDSWSRGSWLGALASLGMMIVAAPRRRWRGVALAVGALTIGGLLWFSGIVPPSLQDRIGSFTADLGSVQDVRGLIITNDNYAVIERLAHWQAGLAMADSHPWLGVGFGNYELAYPAYRLLNWPIPLGHAHNYYINLLAENGLIGTADYLIAWLVLIVLTWRAIGRASGVARGVAIGVLGSWTYLAIHSLFDNLYVNNLQLHVGVLIGLLGAILVLNRSSAAHASLTIDKD